VILGLEINFRESMKIGSYESCFCQINGFKIVSFWYQTLAFHLYVYLGGTTIRRLSFSLTRIMDQQFWH